MEGSLAAARARVDEANAELKRRSAIAALEAKQAADGAEADASSAVAEAKAEAAQLAARNAALQAKQPLALAPANKERKNINTNHRVPPAIHRSATAWC